MPSGAKKRKAARRKQQQHLRVETTGTLHEPPSDSQPNTPSSPQGNGGILHDENSDQHQTSDEEAEEEKDAVSSSTAMSGNGNLEAGEEHVADVAIEVIEVGASKEIDAKQEGFVHEAVVSSPCSKSLVSEDVSVKVEEEEAAKIGLEKPAAEVWAIPIVDSDLVNEEVVQATEAASVTSEAVVDASQRVAEVKEVNSSGSVVEQEKPRDVEVHETAVTDEVNSVTLIQHRATWWNCCGLFDVLNGSQR